MENIPLLGLVLKTNAKRFLKQSSLVQAKKYLNFGSNPDSEVWANQRICNKILQYCVFGWSFLLRALWFILRSSVETKNYSKFVSKMTQSYKKTNKKGLRRRKCFIVWILNKPEFFLICRNALNKIFHCTHLYASLQTKN